MCRQAEVGQERSFSHIRNSSNRATFIMFKLMSKILGRPAGPDSGVLETSDKFGNKLTLCAKCKVPVVRRGAVHKCMNGCYIGETLFAPNETPCEENNYNPLELNICRGCHGDGSTYFEEDGLWCAKPCKQCGGEGVSMRRRYDDETEHALARAVSITVDDDGWTKCPRCNFKFFARDQSVWKNGRHRRCGQMLCTSESNIK